MTLYHLKLSHKLGLKVMLLWYLVYLLPMQWSMIICMMVPGGGCAMNITMGNDYTHQYMYHPHLRCINS